MCTTLLFAELDEGSTKIILRIFENHNNKEKAVTTVTKNNYCTTKTRGIKRL